ncbi:MAG: protein kinase, partial [Gaiellaceae bacterium]
MSIPPPPGTVLAGYELQEVLGRGGMGVVYRALQQGLGRSVALKLLAPELAEDESFRERFLLESRLAASIDHPSIIPVYEAGEQDGQLYLAMRLVEGEDLGAMLARDGRLSPERTLALLGQVGSALDAAHAKGLVHRDVKPANLLIAGGRHVYLSDFGLSRQTSLAGVTATGQLLGTLAYLAPERIEGRALDGRSDLYALACVAFECLTGELPYARAEEAALLYAHLAERPPQVSERVPELAAADEVLVRALAKAPAERQGSCEQLIAELDAALGAADPARRSEIVTLPLPRTREVRKKVTVVLCDVASADGRRLDPELLRWIVPRVSNEIAAAAEMHGGCTEQARGSSVLAVFGIPRLHEDDALRAVRAAVDARTALAELGRSVERESGVALGLRITVGTGEVVANDDPEQSPDLGDAADVFAGLDTFAKAGEITLSEDTYRLVKDAVSVEPGEHRGFRLLGFATSAGHGLDSPIVGRTRERRLLEDAFERATIDSACQLFTMLGTAGVGKSRLVTDFLGHLGDSATVVSGSCLSYGGGITYWPVKEVVRAAAGIEEDDESEAALGKIAAVLGPGEDTPLIAGRIAETIGLADTSASTEKETFWAVREFLEALARTRPLVVVFDDIHWGEPAFLDLIEHVADWSRDVPILLLCMARPELFEKRPGWAGGKLNATSVLLEPLSDAECEELVANLLGRAPFALPIRARIAEAAEGNPLFVEEMLAMLIDDRLLKLEDGCWKATADLTQVAIPPSIQALLAARLDRLTREERSAAECASVEGKVFHVGAVAEMTAQPVASMTQVLGTLARKELIRHDLPQLAGEHAFRFRHLLIRDVAYESLPKRARFGLHERFVGWLEPKIAERPGEYDEIVGYHLEQAYRLRVQLGLGDDTSTTLAEHASARLSAAGHRALSRGDVAAAANLLGRAVSLLGAEVHGRLELMLSFFEALRGTGQLERARLLLDEVVAEAEAQGDERVRMHAELHRLVLQTDTDPEYPTDELQEA